MRAKRFLKPLTLDYKKPGSKIYKSTWAIAAGNKREKTDVKMIVL